jgi:MFS family permease
MEMEVLILGWFVLVATDSALLLASMAALHYGGTLLSPFFGVIADRVDRRTLLIAMRAIYASLAAAVMILGLSGDVQPWQLFVIAGLSGMIKPSDLLVRNSLIADIVPLSNLSNALGIARTTMDSARIIGALLGAGLLSAIGIGAAYGAVVGLYLASVAFSFGITVRRTRPPSLVKPWTELKLGFAYIRDDKILLPTMCLAFLANLTALPLSHGLLPVLARDIYLVDENGLARLVAAFALGALLGSLLMATSFGSSRPGRTMVRYLVGWHVLVIILGHVSTWPLGLALITVSGVRMLAVYGLPLGLVLGGALIELMGTALTFTAYGVTGIAVILAIVLRWPQVLSR